MRWPLVPRTLHRPRGYVRLLIAVTVRPVFGMTIVHLDNGARAKQWLDENHKAISAHNDRVAARSTLLTPLWISDASLSSCKDSDGDDALL